MGGKAKAPPPPDYSGVAKASEASAKYSFEMGQRQLDWAKQQYAQDQAILKQIVNPALRRQAENDLAARQDRARYRGVYQPLENQLVRDARDYASPQREQYDMGRAGAEVAQQFNAQRQGALQNLEAFGVDPSSTRYAALDRQSRIAQAAATAGAENQARGQTEALGRAMRSEAINVGRGYPGQIAGTYGTALQSGQLGANSQLAGTASGANTMGTGMGWQNTGNGALGTWGNTLNAGYQNQLAAFQANQQSSSGLGGLFGSLLGAAGNAGGFGQLFTFEEGGGVPDASQTSGGAIPTSASPSGGREIDDVPARLTPGEFVVPKDVMQWKGEEFFQKLINKSRDENKNVQAKPEMKPSLPQKPTFVSRPTNGAIPVG